MNANTGTITSATGSTEGQDPCAATIVAALGERSLVLVGMMGVGKTVMGRRLAARLSLEFVDSDHEIEAAAGMTIPDIFERYGESYFRERENRVVERLMREGPRVVATGGGAFVHASTRASIKESAISVWIKADIDVLMRRVRKRTNRPLLRTPDPEGTLRRLMTERYPVYAEADVTVISRDGPHDLVIGEMLGAVKAHLCPLDAPGPCFRSQ